MCRISVESAATCCAVCARLRRHARARARRPAALCFGKDKPAEFQNTCKIIFGRNMRPDTEQESRQAMSVIKLYYL